MIGTEFLKGQGLGNQLFCYVSSRCLAIDNGCEFGTAGQADFANNMHSNKGMYFMDIELGTEIENTCDYDKYHEKEDRIFLPVSKHDRNYGCYVSGSDMCLLSGIKDNTLIYGNLQSEQYFISHKEEIKKWLQIKPEYNKVEFTQANICILNMRGGEYVGDYALYLRRRYWKNAMNYMKKIREDMKFVIITEDVDAAHKLFPDIEAYHFGMGEDYAVLHNAHYLILSNSSFAFFPVFTSNNIKYVMAPKYWARHNCSNGYWASEQNIYSGWNYMDRKGKIFSAEECRRELKEFKATKWERLEKSRKEIQWNIKVLYYEGKAILNRLLRKIWIVLIK